MGDDQWGVAAFAFNLSGEKAFADIFDLIFVGIHQGAYGAPRGASIAASDHV